MKPRILLVIILLQNLEESDLSRKRGISFTEQTKVLFLYAFNIPLIGILVILQDFGYLSSPAYGSATMGYTVYGGKTDVVGEYTARVYPSIFDVVPWTLTAKVNDEILWVEGGLWDGTQVTTTLGYGGWDKNDSPFPDFTVNLTSTTTC